MTESFAINTLEELDLVARKITELSTKQTIFLFNGEMGAGKTTLISKVCSLYNVEDNVSSPTYAIYKEYFSENFGAIFHFDCYRLKDEFEALDSGIEEILDSGNICLIEWPDKIENLLPNNYVEIKIELKQEQRLISINYDT